MQCMGTTAADILGLNQKREIPARWATYYQRLCAERDRLLERDFSAPETSNAKLDDLTDAASEESTRSLFLVTASATQAIIAEVLEAIRRIEHRTYGICELTGKPIEAERLRAIPWTRYSLEGQSEAEKSGCAPRLALPSLQSLSRTDSDSDSDAEAETETEDVPA
jgi:RNA polymerase-binding transcription factor DksA